MPEVRCDRNFSIANRTVGDLQNVHLHHSNSVEFLRRLSQKHSGANNCVYLDVHWCDYLRDELSILKDWRSSIVMINDLKVPFFDEEYG
jgi:hypothetical protein